MWPITAIEMAAMVLDAGPRRLNTGAMRFAMRIKSPPRYLLSSIFAGALTVVLAPVVFLRWCLRLLLVSPMFVLRTAGGGVMAVWWSTALFLLSRGNPNGPSNLGAPASLRQNRTRRTR